MKTLRRRSVSVFAAAAVLVLGAPTLAAASAASDPSAVQVPGQVQAQALPSREIWLSDVSAVADQAAAYLRSRLPDGSRKTAIVLDIDNTSLETDYSPGLVSPAVAKVLALAKQADAAGAAVFFVTARPEILEFQTVANLNFVGYPRDGLFMRTLLDFRPNNELKTSNRIAIENQGYTIVANIGNSATDLDGGHAERTFKLPDYDGQLS